MTIRTLFQRIVPHIVAPSLAVLAVLGACSSPNTVVSPAIALNPDDGGPDTEVIVTGTDFPPATEVNVRLGPPDVGATPQSYGRAVTDAAGSFALSFVMPAQWPDGEVITETELVVVAINQDASVKATAPFHFVQVSDASTSDSDSGLVQAYANAEGDFSLLLPPNWEVMGPAESELGTQYLLGPAPLSDRQAPANGSLFIADAGMLSAQEAAQLLCGGCVPPPELEEAVLNGQGARRAIITGPGLAELEWFFIEGNGKTIFFSIHDPDTLETLDGVVQTFNFGRTPTGPAVIPAAQRARQMLAEHLDIDPYRIIIASAEPVEWADACLGAPAVDELCSQTVTPGFAGILQTRGAQYEYRTDQTGLEVRLTPGAVLSARQILAQSGIRLDAIGTVSVVPVEWPDVCLGIHDSGATCAAVVTPGFRVVLEADGETYTYHASEGGQTVKVVPNSPADAPILEWHREGGMAGFCDDLTVDASGTALLTSCSGIEIQRQTLAPYELGQLYAWQSGFGTAEFAQVDRATAYGMTIQVTLHGLGTELVGEADQEAMLTFLTALVSTPTASGVSEAVDAVLETDVQYVLALEDLTLYSGPGGDYVPIGSVFGGQVALVTGVSGDGEWWRVMCPDDTVGSCWLSADPAITLTTLPATEPSPILIAIPEAGIGVSLPQGSMLMKNTELFRRGSFASYDFVLPEANDYPFLSEVQFFSRESIQDFATRCEASAHPCFPGDYPDPDRYDGQKDAFGNLQGYGVWELLSVGDSFALVTDRDCEGADCVVREYVVFVGDTKVDVWVLMGDESQAAQADALFSQIEFQGDFTNARVLPGPLYTLVDLGLTLRYPVGWSVREEVRNRQEFVVRTVSFLPPAHAGRYQPQLPAVNLSVYGAPLEGTLLAWLEAQSTSALYDGEASPAIRFFGVRDVTETRTASFSGLGFAYDVLGLTAHELLFAVGQTAMGLSYVDFGTEDLASAFLQIQSSLALGSPTPPALTTEFRHALALMDVTLCQSPGDPCDPLGQILEGQVVSVTGVSGDGLWWRVMCPNDTIGECWVPADRQLMHPWW
jgi:hypothetical protein